MHATKKQICLQAIALCCEQISYLAVQNLKNILRIALGTICYYDVLGLCNNNTTLQHTMLQMVNTHCVLQMVNTHCALQMVNTQAGGNPV